MRVVLQNSLCDNCNRVYKQKKIVGDDTYYCQENECIYRKISYPKTSTSQNKESINNTLQSSTNKKNLSNQDTPEAVILESIDYQISNLKYHLKELERLKESILQLIENNEDYLTLYNTIHYNREDVKNKHYL